jgi:hypothetical protein
MKALLRELNNITTKDHKSHLNFVCSGKRKNGANNQPLAPPMQRIVHISMLEEVEEVFLDAE